MPKKVRELKQMLGKEDFDGDRKRKPHNLGASAYSMVIHWSDEDDAFIVTLPEFDNARTHGETYEQAVREGKDLIESFIMWYEQDGKPLPEPNLYRLPKTKEMADTQKRAVA
jgi:predicted RNase H-like HicB family nuclease